jgi:hypothetical protein
MAEHESERFRRLIAYSLHSYIYYTQKDAFRYYGGIFLLRFTAEMCMYSSINYRGYGFCPSRNRKLTGLIHIDT